MQVRITQENTAKLNRLIDEWEKMAPGYRQISKKSLVNMLLKDKLMSELRRVVRKK